MSAPLISLIGGKDMEEWEKPFQRVLGCLLQSALMAARRHYLKDAKAILDAIYAVRPDHPSTKFALALYLIYLGDAQQCLDYLNANVLKEEPENEMAIAISCMALNLLDRKDECSFKLSHLINNGKNEQAVSIAKSLFAAAEV